jgi:hypothetical protein
VLQFMGERELWLSELDKITQAYASMEADSAMLAERRALLEAVRMPRKLWPPASGRPE